MPVFDENVLRAIRAQNLFGPEQMVGGNVPPQPTMNTQIFQPAPYSSPPPAAGLPGQTDDALINRLIEMFKPKDTYMDQAAEMLKTIPPREEPRMWRKIMGGVVGGLTRSIPAGREVIEGPYREKLADWATKFGPTSEIAKMEQSRNVNDRMIMASILSNAIAGRRAGAYEENIRSQILKRESDIEAERKRQELRQWLADHPEQEPIFDTDGYVKLINRRTGVTTKTDIRHTEMSELQKLQLQHKYRTEEIEARGAEAEQRATIGKWSTVNVTDPETGKTTSMRLNTVTGEIFPIKVKGVVEKPGTTGAGEGAKAESAKQRKTALYSKALQAANTHPEWRSYIKFPGGTDEFRVSPPGRVFGPDKATYDAINEFIYGTAAPTPMSSRQGAPATPKVGDTKTFPNGNRARWDGKGWVLIK